MKELRFNENGRFRILMLSDAHHAPETGTWTIEAIEKMVSVLEPDLVFLGGDNVTGESTRPDFERLLAELVSPMEKRNIPWAHCFGNHDLNIFIPKDYQESVYESYPGCCSSSGPESLPGIGNYYLSVKDRDGNDVFGIYVLDSHSNFNPMTSLIPYKGLLLPERLNSRHDSEYIRTEQVLWYYSHSKETEEKHGRKIPALMLFHIPLPEFNLVVRNASLCAMEGECNESICSSELNSGLFAAVLERGDVKGIFCGHDHNNTFSGTYCGVKLGYDGSIGTHAYGLKAPDPRGDREFLRGGRIFDLNPDGTFKTEMVLLNTI